MYRKRDGHSKQLIKRSTDRTRRHHRRFVFYLLAVIVIAIVIEILILNSFNKKNSNRTSMVLLNQVVSILEENEQNESGLTETLKEDYIIRAQTVAYILDSKPEAEKDVKELKKIAKMMKIDEIHLFDKNGKIYSGSVPKYYGLTFDSGEQIGYFKPMLKDKSLTMCQDVTPNTAEQKKMMYAITWNESGDKMIQVGIEPVRLLEELRENEISEVVANIPTYDGIDIWVADVGTEKICASTDESRIGTTLQKMGLKQTGYSVNKTVSSCVTIDGYRNYCNARKTGDYIVVAAYSESASVRNFFVALIIEFVYLLVACMTIAYMMKRVLRANEEKDMQMSLLVSMSDIYNSMHLIDLEENLLKEYHARNEVSEVVNNTSGADETLKQLMALTTEEAYYNDALEFTDIHTLPERMQHRKIISKEFMSKAIGWYRGSFIAIETDEDERPTKVVYVTQDIDREKRKEEELLIKSNVDELTGLFNRRAFEEDIAKHNDTVTENDFVFVSFDVNGLKTVNDTLGHVAGDELLLGAANCMRHCFEPLGRVYRVGGDEFAAILFADDTQLNMAKKNFEDMQERWTGNLVDHLSISAGYVKKAEVTTTSVHEMAEVADKKMYEAKSKFYGR